MNRRGSKRIPVQARTVDVYQAVIDDVVSRVKGEFVQEGVDESVLDELRALWEQALQKTGVCDLPESEEESEGDEAPAAGAPRPPAPGGPAGAGAPPPGGLQFPPGMMPPGFFPGAQFGVPPGAVPTPQAMMQMILAHQQAMAARGGVALPFPLPPGMNLPPGGPVQQFAAPPAAPAVPAAPAAAPVPPAAITGQKRALDADAAAEAPPAKQPAVEAPAEPTIPQQDGPADDGAAPAAPAAPAAAAPAADEDAIGPGDSGDELGEADDLADVDDHEEIDEDAITDVILGQFEKVHRSKAKWRINLKNCIATIGGRDYVLKKITGEMNFT